MPAYYKYRPTLGISQSDVLRIERSDRVQPRAEVAQGDVRQWASRGRAGRRLSEARYSHFRSTEIWQTAASGPYSRRPVGSAVISMRRNFRRTTCSTRSRSSPVLPELLVRARVDVPAIDGNLRGYGLISDRKVRRRRDVSLVLGDTTAAVLRRRISASRRDRRQRAARLGGVAQAGRRLQARRAVSRDAISGAASRSQRRSSALSSERA